MAAPHHQFVLSNPFAPPDDSDDEDSSLNSSQPHTPSTVHPASGLRAQLNHLLPRHAFFHVSLQIHQITNIPLVSGEFAVKWKFKNAYGASGNKTGSGLFGGLKARRKARREEKRKRVKEEYPELGALADPGSHRTASLDGHASTWSGAASTSSSSSSSSSKAQKSTDASTSSSSSAPALPASVSAPTTPARGQTPFLRLKDHGVVWEHTLSLLVRMDVDRDPLSMLLPCPVKLTVLQRDPKRPEVKPIPFGVVMLDLSQYASKGEVERRYLLRESKTNATLKLKTHLTHIPSANVSSCPPPPTLIASTSSTISTTSVPPTPHTTSITTNTFTAPPLPKGEILNGISSIIQGDFLIGGFEGDMYRVRPKGLDLYGPYYDQEELEFDLLGGRAAPKSKGKQTEKDKAKAGKDRENDKDGMSTPAPASVRKRERSSTQSFDPSRLPLAYGTKTTELLIEALFNPVETRHKEKESPFTVYVPDPLEGMPKRPAATPVQRIQSDTLTPLIHPSTPMSFIDTSPPRSRSGSTQKGLSPPTSFATPSSRSGASSSGTTLEARSNSSSPNISPLLPSISSRSASSSSYFTSPQPSVTSSPISTPGLTQTPPPLPHASSASASSKKRAQHQRVGNAGIGAGLGIMGLGMGMGVGMGVRVGVSRTRQTSMDDEGERVEKEKEKKDQEEASNGVKAWLRRAAKGPSRPGTPTTPVGTPSVGVAS
ncbi:hypothetical protein C0995_003408 [Termitomyces sp. Mi166|nr:hypothetical protein C0995_003408 [Termitomyces sp. Mi166\